MASQKEYVPPVRFFEIKTQRPKHSPRGARHTRIVTGDRADTASVSPDLDTHRGSIGAAQAFEFPRGIRELTEINGKTTPSRRIQ